MRPDRRTFLQSTAALAGAAALPGRLLLAENEPAAAGDRPWYTRAYRRAVVDMHIPDWDEKFFSKFDPRQYVDRLVESRAQSVVCYCQSHVGLFNFPTKVGQQHAGWKGRNVLAEMVDLCHRAGIAVVLYTSLIFDRWAADTHSEWRQRTWDGKIMGEGGRHGLVCPNSPYREYVRAFVAEICQQFDVEGLRFDMTFWPGVCYCAHCRQRFGGELPTRVNWLDETWVRFQRQREEWLVDFASIATETVRKHRPRASVEHQSSTYPLNWTFGVSAALARQNDFLQGDFYGDSLQGSFVRKLLEDLTPRRPFGYETSFSIALSDHTARKPEPLLEAKAAAAIGDQAAFIFIDAIDPIGSLNPAVYARMGRVFDRLAPYYQHLGGERLLDVALYYSLESKFDLGANGRPIGQADSGDAHTASTMNAARWLIGAHLPLGVVTRRSLERLDRLKTLVLSNVNMLDETEADAIRAWVRRGGKLYASGGSSLVTPRGQLLKDFLLADVLGVSLVRADWTGRERYVAPTAAGAPLFDEFSAEYPAFVTGYGIDVRARPGAEVLATTTLPWPAPKPTQFASIHSNPPWLPSDRPELVRNAFGAGTAIYSSSLLENVEQLGSTFVRIVRALAGPCQFEVDAPSVVEATLFEQRDRRRVLLTLTSFQKDLPNIPIEHVEVRLRLAPRRIRRVVQLPDGQALAHQMRDGQVIFTLPRLETLAMVAAELE